MLIRDVSERGFCSVSPQCWPNRLTHIQGWGLICCHRIYWFMEQPLLGTIMQWISTFLHVVYWRVNLKFDWQIPNQISHAVFKISKHKISNLDCKFLFLNFLKRSDVKYLANKSQISMWTINSRTVVQLVLILITTLKPQSNGPSYSNTVITTLAWPLMGVLGTSRKGLGGAVARSGPSSLYQM